MTFPTTSKGFPNNFAAKSNFDSISAFRILVLLTRLSSTSNVRICWTVKLFNLPEFCNILKSPDLSHPNRKSSPIIRCFADNPLIIKLINASAVRFLKESSNFRQTTISIPRSQKVFNLSRSLINLAGALSPEKYS